MHNLHIFHYRECSVYFDRGGNAKYLYFKGNLLLYVRFLRLARQWKPSSCQIWVTWNFTFLLCVICNEALVASVLIVVLAGRCAGFGGIMRFDLESQSFIQAVLWKTAQEEMRCLVFLFHFASVPFFFFFFYSSLSFAHSCIFLFSSAALKSYLFHMHNSSKLISYQTIQSVIHRDAMRDLGALCHFARRIKNF